MKKVFILLAGSMLLGLACLSFGQWLIDVENGVIRSGSNDVEIPPKMGPPFSLSEELKIKTAYFFRLRLGYQ